MLIGVLIAAGSVISFILDQVQLKREKQAAQFEGREIHRPYGPYEAYFKRPMDFALSSLAIIILFPVLLGTVQ